MPQVTIGGERLGAGQKNKAYLHNYQRSNHDLSYVWRSTIAPGTLIPFMVEPALPGDTFDIHLSCEMLTNPTIGPLFGTYKIQLDVFQIPIRLYQAQLHMNMLGIGLDMSKVKLPQIELLGRPLVNNQFLDNQQINASCIFSYLNIRGIGHNPAAPNTFAVRNFNAIPYLAYWDIYKNYYANKQEEIGAVIHRSMAAENTTITAANLENTIPTGITIPISPTPPLTYTDAQLQDNSQLILTVTNLNADLFNPGLIMLDVIQLGFDEPLVSRIPATDFFTNWIVNVPTNTVIGQGLTPFAQQNEGAFQWGGIFYSNTENSQIPTEPTVKTFPLTNIDDMRMRILQHTPATDPFIINTTTPLEPYTLPLQSGQPIAGINQQAMQFSQEGLALKTYNSDLLNNWISTEWIDGPDGISAVTAIDTTGGSFTIDELNLSKKIYDMLNRIAISGGSYDDWLDAVYTHERQRSAENPMYIGGLIKNLVFQEVVSNTGTPEQPLGSLAGRGKLGQKHKGGHIIAKVDEPSYIMGIISLTPNLDYSQGNKWDVNLKTMNDFHKPALDQIGFQDLVTDQMAWWDTKIDNTGEPIAVFKSAGKQPAWINYMTNINQVRGNFAQLDQMYMVLNRRYQPEYDPTTGLSIKDLTTYIDPAHFNHIFAQTSRDAQNFWAQIGVNIEARRKMSAKVIPNL